MRHIHNGFTLIKMLVVVAMVGLFAGLALYGVRQSHVR
ncbi:type II secretion system GspH family protein [Pendulispora brunnea]|uniref:Type II secretion system GspH family protein n=1 Tax=Pendulispora brunnea TaxID=2905690 RepID=A0ABZ2KIE1_9BACT